MKAIEGICKGTPPGVPALRYDISSPTRANISHQRYIAPHSGISQIPQGIYIAANKKKVGVFCSQLVLVGYLYCYAQKREMT